MSVSVGSNPRITAYVDNACYECGKSYSSAAVLIKHMKDQHSIELKPRAPGPNRPASTKYNFINKRSYHRRTLFGCPSCWYHCPQNYNFLREHIADHHLAEDAVGFEDPVSEDGDFSDEEEDEEDISSKKTYYGSLINTIHSKVDELASLFNNMVFSSADTTNTEKFTRNKKKVSFAEDTSGDEGDDSDGEYA
jgi:Pyruvate/2-oxoacid:ferredoxin oxidoreductase delta subunit